MTYRDDLRSVPLTRSFLALAFASIFAMGGFAQSGSDAETSAADGASEGESEVETFFEAVDVEIVNIDVWVTDKSGSHVTGLTRDDFQVLRNGEPVETTNFYAVENGVPAESVARVERRMDDVPPAPRPGLRSPLAPEHRLWLIVYVDNFNSDPIERNRSLPALRQFLGKTVRPGDQVMLVSFDRSLKVRQPFTDSTSQILAKLEEIYDDTGFAVTRRREQYDALERIGETEHEVTALATAMNYADSQMLEVEETAEALERLIETMAGLPGRKALVYLSSGVPMQAGEELFYAVGSRFSDSRAFSEIGRHDTSRSFERVARKANSHRVVFYPLDAGGQRGLQFGAAEYGEFVSPTLRRTLDSVVVENLHAPLRVLAQETGGRAILNRNELLPGLDEVFQDFRSFYSLGIANANVEQGRYHEVEVRLKDAQLDKAYEIRHRTGYRSRSLDARMGDGLRSALLYGFEENPIGMQVRWGREETESDDGELWMLPVQVSIPLRDLVLLPIAGGKHELRLRLYVGVADERGDISEIDRVPLGLRIDDQHVEAAKGESFVYVHKLLLNPGRKKIGLAVLDLVGRDSSYFAGAVQVGPSEDFEVVD